MSKTKNNWLVSKLRALHANQSGAVAFMVLCALMMCLMLALVVYDTTPAARQKIEVQTAADTAAWSQSAVEARTMNMMALANVGKRIIVGQTMYYEMIWAAWALMIVVTIVVLVAAIITCFFGVGCPIITPATQTLANIAKIMAMEATDMASFIATISKRAKQDVQAIDKYQTHFKDLTPWWSWGESWRRGLRNGAYVSGWPVPKQAFGSLGQVPGIGSALSSGKVDSLPIKRDDSWKEQCLRSFSPDVVAYIAEYLAVTIGPGIPGIVSACGSTCTTAAGGGGIPPMLLYPISAGIAAGFYALECLTNAFTNLTFGTSTYPFELTTETGAAWSQATANTVFAYRPGRKLQSADFRGKYDFMRYDLDLGVMNVLYQPDGFFGMARSEISYQDGAPDLWHAGWSARMRPIALPGEWKADGSYRLISAFNDAAPYIFGSAAIGDVLGPLDALGEASILDLSTDGMAADLIKAEVAFDAMTDDRIEGVAR